MGQPKFPRKSYQTPNHPWQGDRIKAEHEIRRKFGLKNKTEIWKAESRLREIRGQARTLVSKTRNPDDLQAQREAKLLLKRLHRQGYVEKDASLNEVLGLDVERILNRRLQSQVYLKGMARTMKQARQFVSHGVVRIGDRRVTVPSYVVRREEEEAIAFDPAAPVADESHPIRPKPAGYEAVQEMEQKDEPKEAPAKEEAPTEEPAKEEAPAEAPKPTDAPTEEPAKEEAPTEEPAKEETPTEEPAEAAESKDKTPEEPSTESPAGGEEE